MHGKQPGNAATFRKDFAYAIAPRLRGNHRHDDVFRRHDEAETDAEAVTEHQHLPFRQVLLDVRVVDLLLLLVRNQDHDDVAPGSGLGNRHDAQAGVLRLLKRLARRRQADDDLNAAVLQVQRVGVPLRSVANDRDLFAPNQIEISILVVVHRGHDQVLLMGVWGGSGWWGGGGGGGVFTALAS